MFYQYANLHGSHCYPRALNKRSESSDFRQILLFLSAYETDLILPGTNNPLFSADGRFLSDADRPSWENHTLADDENDDEIDGDHYRHHSLMTAQFHYRGGATHVFENARRSITPRIREFLR